MAQAARVEFEPVKVGWLGACLDGEGGAFDKIHRMAFDEAFESGVFTRKVEHVIHPENGLPRGSARNAIDGYRWLVDQGCVVIAGAYSSDNAIAVTPYVDEAKVPIVSWCGTERFQGEYCFQLGNGDCGGDAALMASWLKRKGYRRIAVLNEVSPNGEEYFRFFRQECRRLDVTLGAVETVTQNPEDLSVNLRNLQQSGCDALAYMGYGMLAAQGLMRPALEKIGWNPPRIMTTAFMFYLRGFEHFEGWTGIDQYSPENPLVEPFRAAFEKRYGHPVPMWPNAIPLLAYDTARVMIEALHRAPILSGPGVKDGLERIRFLPSTTGGPRTHIACSPYDHKMFKGDWLLYGRVRNEKLEFEGYFEPV
ncbi:MAG: amino acid ABC transporter substrate-binding protein [Deltaproteobacteria bacterium]|nr:amino acid ABC transporter substrate-binding protein [Deltaproteobacteria bacterium]